jgi:hypothetical protein
MKTAIAILVFVTLLAAPVACTIVVCPELEAHHCCPKPKSFAACPFDILASAKASLATLPAPIVHLVIVTIAQSAPVSVPSTIFRDRDLHLENRVLRI